MPEESSCDGHSLPLPAAELESALSDQRVKALWHALNCLSQLRQLCKGRQIEQNSLDVGQTQRYYPKCIRQDLDFTYMSLLPLQ